MRIALVTPEYPDTPGMGGIGTNAATLAQELTRRGHEVFVVMPDVADRQYAVAGVAVHKLRRPRLPDPHAAALLTRRRIARLVARLGVDVVHAAEYGALAWWIARWSAVPVVTRLATPTYVVEELNRRRAGQPRTAVRRWMERNQAKHSAAVYAPTRSIADRVGGDWGPGLPEIEIISNAIDVSAVRRAAERPPALELPERFLAFYGRLERRKGVDTLGRALPRILSAHPDLHAVVVGSDPGDEGGAVTAAFRRDVAAVADRVRLVGELPRDAALAVVARAQLVVLPSVWESFGHVCVEALALGRPVVASRAGGFSEIVEDRVSGWLFPPGDDQALAESVLALLSDPHSLGLLAKHALERAETFDVGSIVPQVEQLLLRAADTRMMGAGIYRRGYRRHFRPDAHENPFHRLYARKRDLTLGAFHGTGERRVLDVGGGYGRVAGPLSRRHRVTLCDISAEMLKEARARCGDAVALLQADARALPFRDGAYDAVVALDLLCHLGDPVASLHELARVVRAGGRILFDTTNARPWWVLAYPSYASLPPRRLVDTLRGGGVLPEWRDLVTHHLPDQVRRAAHEVGLDLRLLAGVGPPGLVKYHLWEARKGVA
jgi:glycogen synthase